MSSQINKDASEKGSESHIGVILDTVAKALRRVRGNLNKVFSST